MSVVTRWRSTFSSDRASEVMSDAASAQLHALTGGQLLHDDHVAVVQPLAIVSVASRPRRPAATPTRTKCGYGDVYAKDDRRIDLLRIENRGREGRDQVTVRVRLTLITPGLRRLDHRRRRWIDERWTLLLIKGQTWRLVKAEGFSTEAMSLIGAQITNPAEDDQRLQEQALGELVVVHDPAVEIASLTDRQAPAHQQLLDLSVVDDRFSPAVIEVTLKRLIELWEQATKAGQVKDQMAQYADRDVIRGLTLPQTIWEQTTFVITDASMSNWKPLKIKDDERDGAQLEVELKVSAVRYLMGRPGTRGPQPPGNRDKPRQIHLRWTLQSTDHHDPPWRLIATSNPAADLPAAMP